MRAATRRVMKIACVNVDEHGEPHLAAVAFPTGNHEIRRFAPSAPVMV